MSNKLKTFFFFVNNIDNSLIMVNLQLSEDLVCLLEYFFVPDVIGNLTALQTLDLSYNDINDMSERDVFLPPLNLTNLYLRNNHLNHVPLDKILPLPNLKVLDLEENKIGVFDEKFMKIIKNGTILKYSGNKKFNLIQIQNNCCNF